MSVHHRSTAPPRQQISDASLHIARRLVNVLELSPTTSQITHVEAGARLIEAIRREVANLLQSSPGELDPRFQAIAIGRLGQALDILEVLEGSAGNAAFGQRPHAPMPPAAPLVPSQASRNLEDLFAAARGPAAEHSMDGYGHPVHAAPPYPTPEPSYPRSNPPPFAGGSSSAVPPAMRPPVRAPHHSRADKPAGDNMLQRLSRAPLHAASLAVATAFVSVVFAVSSFFLRADRSPDTATSPALAGTIETGQPSKRAYRTAGDDRAPEAAPARREATIAIPADPRVRVVLLTRPTSAEVLEDFRALKQSYPALLANAEARVDAVPLPNKETWHRLSLAGSLTQSEAKARCTELHRAGFTGCWLKPVTEPDV